MFLSPKKALLKLMIVFKTVLFILNIAHAEVADTVPVVRRVVENYTIPMDPESQRLRAERSFDQSLPYDMGGPTQAQITIAQRRFPMNTVEGRTDLIQLYPEFNTRAGFCGSYVYSGPDNVQEESFADPMTACVVARLAEEWRLNHCPSNRPCRLEMGDISHHTNEIFDGHSSHTDGYCIDLRPIKNEGEGDRAFSNPDYSGALTHEDPNYDQAKTKELLELLTRLGGDTISSSTDEPAALLFNDPDLIEAGLARQARDHDNHIHVCFRPDNPVVQNSCAEYTPNERVCPTVGVLFNHPVMHEMKEVLNETL